MQQLHASLHYPEKRQCQLIFCPRYQHRQPAKVRHMHSYRAEDKAPSLHQLRTMPTSQLALEKVPTFTIWLACSHCMIFSHLCHLREVMQILMKTSSKSNAAMLRNLLLHVQPLYKASLKLVPYTPLDPTKDSLHVLSASSLSHHAVSKLNQYYTYLQSCHHNYGNLAQHKHTYYVTL